MTRLKLLHILVRLETVLVSVQDRWMVCGKRTIGLEIIWMQLMVPLVMRLKWKLV